MTRGRFALVAALTAVLLVTIVVAAGIGPVAIPPLTSARIMLNALWPGSVVPDWSPNDAAIIWQLRVPRVLLGALVGAGLAVVGATLQAATRNPLADPYLFGISSGAALGVVTVTLLIGPVLGAFSLPVAAFAGALLAIALVTGIARGHSGLTPERLILGGVAVSFVLMAGTNFMLFTGDQHDVGSVLFWMLGSLGHARWELLGVPFVVVAAGLAFLFLQAGRINALLLGDESATTLGIEVARFRQSLFVVCALITGTLVAVSGAIGFVGLMIPHFLRPIAGGEHRHLLPACALGGAIFLVWVDVCARTVLAPEDLPIGIFTAAIGGSFFLWQMTRSPRP